MNTRQLLNFVDKLPKALRQEQVIKLLYILKAWKILSANNGIENVDLNYDTFFNSKIETKKLMDLFKTLAKQHKVFSLFLEQSNILSKISDQDLVKLISSIEFQPNYPTVAEVFFSALEGMNDYNVSSQVAELGVKLLGNTCDSIYSPFSNSYNLGYYTDKEVFAESMADEFIIELMKVLDDININFTHTDTLEKPAYINENAPHLLRQFSCTLSFPPMGLSLGKALKNEDKFNRFTIHKGRGNRDVAHVEHILAQTKSKAVILLPVGMTYRAGTELELRKHLIDSNILEAIIQLPSNLHHETSIETTFFIIDKNKKDDGVYFLNLKDKQFFAKDGRKTVLNDLSKILKMYEEKEEVENTSGLVSNKMIIQNNYALSIDRYIVSKEAAEIQKQLSKYELIELQDIADIRRSQLFKDEGEGAEIYEVSPSDLAKSGFTKNGGKAKYIDKQLNKLGTYMLEPFDILVSTKGTIGKVGLVIPENNYLVASQAMEVIRLKDSNYRKAYILYMFLKSEIGQSLLRQLVAGVAMPQISTVEIKKLKIPLLSEEEEDQVIDNYNKEIELYKELENIEQKIEQIHNNFLGTK